MNVKSKNKKKKTTKEEQEFFEEQKKYDSTNSFQLMNLSRPLLKVKNLKRYPKTYF
jgi:hypothetical protein